MHKVLLTAQLNAVAGREAEFTEWYTNVHLRDVLRMKGTVAVQRFIQDEVQLKHADHSRFAFLTACEVDDARAVSDGHAQAAGTDEELVFSSAADLTDSAVFYYYPKVEIPGLGEAGSARSAVYLEFDGDSQKTRDAASQTADAVARLLAPETVVAGSVVAHYRSDDQMFRRPPKAPSILLLLSTLDPWRVAVALNAAGEALMAASRVTVHRPASARITKEQVVGQGPTCRELAARRRALAGPRPRWGRPRLTAEQSNVARGIRE